MHTTCCSRFTLRTVSFLRTTTRWPISDGLSIHSERWLPIPRSTTQPTHGSSTRSGGSRRRSPNSSWLCVPTRSFFERMAFMVGSCCAPGAMPRLLSGNSERRSKSTPGIPSFRCISALRNEVFVLLEKAYREHHGNMPELLLDDCWDPVRDDPRFKELLDRMGFSKVSPSRK